MAQTFSHFLPFWKEHKLKQCKAEISKAPKHTTIRSQTQQSSASSLENKDVVHAMDLHNFKWQKTTPMQVTKCSEENSDSGDSWASKELEAESAFREHITVLVDFTAFLGIQFYLLLVKNLSLTYCGHSHALHLNEHHFPFTESFYNFLVTFLIWSHSKIMHMLP